MPNYGRYGGPENYYQGGGDGSFDPYTGRLNVGQLIQQFILRKRAEEEQKKKDAQDASEQQWQGILRGLQEQKYQQDIEAGKREAQDYQSPAQLLQKQKDLETHRTNEQIRQEKARIDAQAEVNKALKKLEVAEKTADLEYADKVAAAKAGREALKERSKTYSALVKAITGLNKTINSLDLEIKKAEKNEDEPRLQTLLQQKYQFETERNTYEEQRIGIANDVIGASDEPEKGQKRLPANLPTKRTGPLGLVGKKVPYVPESKTKYTKGSTKIINGVTYYFWESDNQWHNSPEPSQPKK